MELDSMVLHSFNCLVCWLPLTTLNSLHYDHRLCTAPSPQCAVISHMLLPAARVCVCVCVVSWPRGVTAIVCLDHANPDD